MTYLIALFCVVGIACGQILFKLSAASLQKTGSWFDPSTMVVLFASFALYGVMTVAWIWVLQKADLGKVYPLMALAFVIVPLGSHLVFGERFQPQYFVGVALIISGIVIAVRSA
ncbi:4-amino-4-deoxy-L-arabinose-phospho-UDP flippase [Luteibacter pinisoli]|uniref:4-amino-4-deoxy-L-arabinose-phospho-UDP flippase n=1 Tax=Luteibacter pinisoli TaxID=2589080 RepID=A0A4Y5Z0U6_9GAMM|nr:EamA family transporter [Luteibacter pinisoli]QDE38801.1 4-amino-4-deoxy-L-arabinose-phospho-UDP flippase [Luteibacter pinisoli]